MCAMPPATQRVTACWTAAGTNLCWGHRARLQAHGLKGPSHDGAQFPAVWDPRSLGRLNRWSHGFQCARTRGWLGCGVGLMRAGQCREDPDLDVHWQGGPSQSQREAILMEREIPSGGWAARGGGAGARHGPCRTCWGERMETSLWTVGGGGARAGGGSRALDVMQGLCHSVPAVCPHCANNNNKSSPGTAGTMLLFLRGFVIQPCESGGAASVHREMGHPPARVRIHGCLASLRACPLPHHAMLFIWGRDLGRQPRPGGQRRQRCGQERPLALNPGVERATKRTEWESWSGAWTTEKVKSKLDSGSSWSSVCCP